MPKKRYTHIFARYVLSLLRLMTLLDVALHLGISWDTEKGLMRSILLAFLRQEDSRFY